ncbi:MAG: family N-acetyltransferase [Eubacterium sp.]|jgi:RimJ/RimL family protein N-acetyltransferase|nr:family N-acetyltransferase [Eubacterium sp.]
MNEKFSATFLPVLETNRLFLLPWKLEYAKDMLFFASNENVVNPGGWKLITDVKKAKNRIKRYMAGSEEWAIALKSQDNFIIIGSIGMRSTIAFKEYDLCKTIGYVLAEEYWGQGLCSEAVQELIKYTFFGLKCDAIAISHHVFNTRSRRVIEKCKFKLRGIYAKSRPDDPYSKVCYIMTFDDYKNLYGISEWDYALQLILHTPILYLNERENGL